MNVNEVCLPGLCPNHTRVNLMYLQLHNVIGLCRPGILYLFYHLAYDLNRSCTIAIIKSDLSLHLSCVFFPYNFFVAIIYLYVLLLIPC